MNTLDMLRVARLTLSTSQKQLPLRAAAASNVPNVASRWSSSGSAGNSHRNETNAWAAAAAALGIFAGASLTTATTHLEAKKKQKRPKPKYEAPLPSLRRPRPISLTTLHHVPTCQRFLWTKLLSTVTKTPCGSPFAEPSTT